MSVGGVASMHILNHDGWNGRGVEVSVECDARQPLAAVAESLSSVADGDLLRTEGGDGAGERFLESFLEGKETVVEVFSMDAGDERVLRFRKGILERRRGLMRFDLIDIQFDSAVYDVVLLLFDNSRMQSSRRFDMMNA